MLDRNGIGTYVQYDTFQMNESLVLNTQSTGNNNVAAVAAAAAGAPQFSILVLYRSNNA